MDGLVLGTVVAVAAGLREHGAGREDPRTPDRTRRDEIGPGRLDPAGVADVVNPSSRTPSIILATPRTCAISGSSP
jgi:hypothetical protein